MSLSGRKVSRVGVTEGASGTKKRQKALTLRICRFCLIFRFGFSAMALSLKKTLVSHSPSAAPRQLPLGGSLHLCLIFPLCRRKARTKNQALKTESPHISFCGSAVGHYEPFWEEGVTRKRDERSPRDQSAAKGHTVAGFCVFGSFSSMFCIH